MTHAPPPPEGTSALVIAPWSPHEVYGVAARWAHSDGAVYSLDGDGLWQPTGRQVADYCHCPCSAMAEQLREALLREALRSDPELDDSDADDEAHSLADEAEWLDELE